MINAKFKDSPLGPIPQDWEVKRLGEVCEKIGSGATPAGGATNYCKTGIALIRSQNVLDGRFAFGGLAYINEIQASELDNVEVQSKDVLLNITGDSVARACIVSDLALPARVNQHVCIIRVVSKLCNPLYLSGSLVAEKKRLLAAAFGGGTRNALTKADVEAFQIAIPPLSEQRRIAEALGEMDRLIELLDAQIVKKRRIAQGLAHDLLGTGNGEQGTGNGECGMRNEPIRRLPGFKGEWVKRRLGEATKINRGGSPRPIESWLTTSVNGINWIKIGDVAVGAKYIWTTAERIVPEAVQFSKIVKPGDFLLSNSMSFGRPYILKISGCIHDGWLTIQDYKDTFDSEYLYYILGSEAVLQQYIALADGSSVKNLNKDKVEKVRVSCPPLPEQRAIAEVLAAVDDEIAALETKRDKYMRIKEGMMRNLLSGRVRVNAECGMGNEE